MEKPKLIKGMTLNELQEKLQLTHNNKYTYINFNPTNGHTKITILCPTHGEFSQCVFDHLKGHGCRKCSRENASDKTRVKIQDFITASLFYYKEYNYDYSKVEITTNNKQKVTVICPKHGEFYPTVMNHMQGKAKCKHCISTKQQQNLWSYSEWEIAGKNSCNFAGYCLYIIKCFNEEETFIKIGKTFIGVNNRYSSKYHMPYQYTVLQEHYGSATYISELENTLKLRYKEFSYSPYIQFPGYSECFDISIIDSLNILPI